MSPLANSIRQIFEYGIALGGGLGIVVIAASVLVNRLSKFKSEKITDENTLIVFLQNQIKGYTTIIDSYKAEIKDLSNQVAAINGKMEEKDKQLQLFKDIVAGRDPEAKRFQELMLKAIQDQADDRTKASQLNEQILHAMQATNHQLELLNPGK